MKNKMKNIFSLILFLSFAFGFGQNSLPVEKEKTQESEYTQIFTSVDVSAQPNGGMQSFRKFIGTSFRLPVVYTAITATVVARFVVWDDGSIRDVQIVKETPDNLGLGKEAIRVISSSDKWTPGIYNGRNVNQYYTLPISIQITAADKVSPEQKKE